MIVSFTTQLFSNSKTAIVQQKLRNGRRLKMQPCHRPPPNDRPRAKHQRKKVPANARIFLCCLTPSAVTASGRRRQLKASKTKAVLPPSSLFSLAPGSSSDLGVLRYAAAYPHSLRSLRSSSRIFVRALPPTRSSRAGPPGAPSSNLKQAKSSEITGISSGKIKLSRQAF